MTLISWVPPRLRIRMLLDTPMFSVASLAAPSPA